MQVEERCTNENLKEIIDIRTRSFGFLCAVSVVNKYIYKIRDICIFPLNFLSSACFLKLSHVLFVPSPF